MNEIQGGQGRDLGTARVDLAEIGVGLTTEEVLVPLYADLTGYFCGELRLGLRFAGVDANQLGCAQPFENLSLDEVHAAKVLGYCNSKQWEHRDQVGMRPVTETEGGARGMKWKALGQTYTLVVGSTSCPAPLRLALFVTYCHPLIYPVGAHANC